MNASLLFFLGKTFVLYVSLTTINRIGRRRRRTTSKMIRRRPKPDDIYDACNNVRVKNKYNSSLEGTKKEGKRRSNDKKNTYK